MKILFLAAEAAPLSQASGLGELAGALPRALAGLGHDVRVAIPFSGVVDRKRFVPTPIARFHVPHIGGDQVARVSEVRHASVTFYLIDGPPIPRARRVYGRDIHEDGPKFVFTSLAGLGLCRALNWQPDVVHGHDGPSSPALYWLDTDGLHDPLFRHTASVFTIHNLASTNTGAGRYLREYGLTPSDSPLLPDWARDSLVGLGLAHAGMLSAVCPGYTASKILTPEYGCGLEGVLDARRQRLAGIANGLDLDTWNPRRDPHLAARYDADSLDRRAANKRALQKALGLAVHPRAPVIGIVSGLGTQPNSGIAVPALRALLSGGGPAQVVVLGAGLPAVKAELQTLAREYPESVRLRPGPNAALSSRIYAGADLLLAPSRCEPGGLAQMIALRYGAVPLVRATGGLADIVVDYSLARRGTGFSFTEYNSSTLLAALRRALRVYRWPDRWGALQRRGMRQARQFSWARSAEAYLALYQQAIAYRKEAVTRLSHRLAGDPGSASSGGRDGPLALPGPAMLR